MKSELFERELQASKKMKRRHTFEMQLVDNLKEAVESERALKQHATHELDELKRKQTVSETDFNKAQAEKARLLTIADKTWLDHQRQLADNEVR